MRILLIDNDESWAFFIKQVIPMHEVFHALDMPQGMSWLDLNDVDVVLLDLSLPSRLFQSDTEGIEQLVNFNSELPIIILTGKFTSGRVIDAALLAGAQSWLNKDWLQGTILNGQSPLLATVIREASIRKMLSNTLHKEREQYLAFFSALLKFLSSLYEEINLIAEDPQTLDRLIKKISGTNKENKND